MTAEKSQTEQWLEELTATVSERKQYYGKTLVGIVLVPNNRQELRVRYGLVYPFRKSKVPKELTYDYDGTIILLKQVYDTETAFQIFTTIVQDQHITIGKYDRIPLLGRLNRIQVVPSFTYYSHFQCGWPAHYTYYDIPQNETGQIPYDALLNPRLPPYPDGKEAIRHFFDLPGDSQINPRIEFFVPDYRARILRLHLAGNTLRLDVEPGELASQQLSVSVFCKTKNQETHTAENLIITNGICRFVVEGELLEGDLYLVTSEEKARIDWISFNLRSETRDPRISFEVTVPALIHQHLDPGFETLREWVSGEGRRNSQNFEQGVSLLLSLVGFTVEFVGEFERALHKRLHRAFGVDLVAYSPNRKTVILGQCTLGPPSEQKVGELRVTASELNALQRCKVVPTIFTTREEEHIKDKVRQLESEGIRVIGKESIEWLLTCVRKGISIEQVIQFFLRRSVGC